MHISNVLDLFQFSLSGVPLDLVEFTPYNPESPGLQIGDEGDFKSKDKEKPRPLGWDIRGLP